MGDKSVGKTCLVNRILVESDSERQVSTVGVVMREKKMTHESNQYVIQFYDSAGKDCYRKITKAYSIHNNQ